MEVGGRLLTTSAIYEGLKQQEEAAAAFQELATDTGDGKALPSHPRKGKFFGEGRPGWGAWRSVGLPSHVQQRHHWRQDRRQQQQQQEGQLLEPKQPVGSFVPEISSLSEQRPRQAQPPLPPKRRWRSPPPPPSDAAQRVVRAVVAAKSSCRELWALVEANSVPKLTFRALSGVMDRCAKLYMQQRSTARHDETAACRQLLNAAAQEMGRLDAWGLTSFIRLAAAVKYLPAEHLAAWRDCMLGQCRDLIPQGVANCLLSLGTLLTDAAPPPALAAGAAGRPGFPAPSLPPRQAPPSLPEAASVAAMASAAARMLSSVSARAAAATVQPGPSPVSSADSSGSHPASAAGAAGGPASSVGAVPQPPHPPGEVLAHHHSPSQGHQPPASVSLPPLSTPAAASVQQSLRDPSTYELVGLLVQHALDVAPSLTPQGLANTMYGIAVLGWPLTEQQTEYFLAQVECKAAEFNHLEASQIVQAWAKVEDRIEVTRGFAPAKARTYSYPTRETADAAAAAAAGEESCDDVSESNSEDEDGEEEEEEEEEEELAVNVLKGFLIGKDEDEEDAVERREGSSASGGYSSTRGSSPSCRSMSAAEEDWPVGAFSGEEVNGSEVPSAAALGGPEGLPWRWRQRETEQQAVQELQESSVAGGKSPGSRSVDGQGAASRQVAVLAIQNVFGKLRPAARSVKYVSCYPGVAVMDTLVARVYSQRQQMTLQSLSQFVHSVGHLRHKPPPTVLQGLLAQLEGFLGSSSGGGCLAAATALLGCAKLAVPPSESFIAACIAAIDRDTHARIREVLTIAWSLATLRMRLSAASNTVLFHAYTLAKLSNPRGAIQLEPALADPARAAYLRQRSGQGPRKITSFQIAVLHELRAMGYEAKMEFPIGGGLLWVDIMVPELNLVVEVDGPWHFIHNTEEYTGGTVCRNWLIERLGYRLIAVGNPFWQHVAELDFVERSYLLRRFFREFHGLLPKPGYEEVGVARPSRSSSTASSSQEGLS
ncbi:hypothetical protein N2152v2_008336 [Parachlorella kessleri]